MANLCIIYHYHGMITEQMEALESKWVNPVLDIIGVNSLRIGGLQMIDQYNLQKHKCEIVCFNFSWLWESTCHIKEIIYEYINLIFGNITQFLNQIFISSFIHELSCNLLIICNIFFHKFKFYFRIYFTYKTNVFMKTKSHIL